MAGVLSFFESALAPHGLIVFSTSGRVVAERLTNKTAAYGLTEDLIDQVLRSYRRTGFGYRDYPGQRDYGISLSKPWWVMRTVASSTSLRVINYTESGWIAHQDVVSCMSAW